jgi:hypothetical protein
VAKKLVGVRTAEARDCFDHKNKQSLNERQESGGLTLSHTQKLLSPAIPTLSHNFSTCASFPKNTLAAPLE